MGRINHTPFNLEQAINGKAFYLQNGYRGVIRYGVEDRLMASNTTPDYPYIGYILDDKGFVYKTLASWDENGKSNISTDYNATTMVEENAYKQEEYSMKPFNITEALQGNPVRLRNGMKGIIYYQVPDKYTFNDGQLTYRPLKGMVFNEEGHLSSSQVAWLNNGKIAEDCEHTLDIVGMYEEDISSLIQKAFKEKLPLKLRNGTKVYIATILTSNESMTKNYPVVAYGNTTAAYRYTLDGNFTIDSCNNSLDIIGLWEEENIEEEED